MADATTVARERIDKALALLERRVLELKARAATPSAVDGDLFAPSVSAGPGDQRRIAELEAAGRDASAALAAAAQAVRDLLDEDED